MSILFAYLLKLAFCLALGYVFYFALLRQMTWYNWNRYFLVLFPVAAIFIPLLPVSLPGEIQPLSVSFFVTEAFASPQNAAANTSPAAVTFSWISLCPWIMLAGMAFLLLRFAIRLFSLFRTRSHAQMVHNGDIKLYHLDGCTAPFSFYNSIYLDTTHYDETELDKIITHEAVHISQKHTMDTMLAELLCIVQWFNPFAWMMKNAIRQNLEFIADDAVLQNGASRTGYQYLLLKVSGAIPHTLANNLLFPSLKKRIQMMNRERTKRSHLWKFACLVPLTCVLLLAFSGPAPKSKSPNIATNELFSLSSLSFFINDEAVAAIVKKDQGNSFLRAGGPLSLALISEEKTRLQLLLERNGYTNIDSHSISFSMDTSAATRSFSVGVTINIDQSQRQRVVPLAPTHNDNTAVKPVRSEEVQYIIASQNNTQRSPATSVYPKQNQPNATVPEK